LIVNFWHRCFACFFLSCSLVFATSAGAQQQPEAALSDYPAGVTVELPNQTDQSIAQPASPATQQTPEELQQLVAPIALYADALVAQILAASTYPTEVVEADRWMQQHPDLKGPALAQAADQQPWDPSLKALTQFPSVLENMDRNLSWTSALGDAYVNQPQDVLNAVQVLRQRAQTAGSLQNTSQQTVTTRDQTIAIAPADPQVVYVPAYDPWLVYGAPLAAYPGWVAVPGIYYAGPDLYFGMGFGLGLYAGFGWGWRDWGFDWHDRRMLYHHAPYRSHSRTFVDRHGFDHGAHFDLRGAHLDHGVTHFDHGTPFHGGGPDRTPAFHEQAGAPGHPAAHSGAFSGFDHGGIVRGYSSHARSSFGGGVPGGGFHAAGPPGFHGGGSHGGGGHR
jgi:hypothetical protein